MYLNIVTFLVFGVTLAIYASAESNEQPIPKRLIRQTSDEGLTYSVCVLPEPLENGKYRPSTLQCPEDNTTPACKMLPYSYVPPNWVLYYTCDRGYVSDKTSTVAVCIKGQWKPTLATCKKLCPPLRSHSMELNCTFGEPKVSCDQPMRPGTVVTQKCKEYHSLAYEPESMEITCLDSGVWDYPLAYCTQDDVCRKEGDSLWTCKKINDCPKAQEGLGKGVLPETCYISENTPLICCEPTLQTRIDTNPVPQPEERKSIQMCNKYAESVFVSRPTNEGTVKVDTCALVEPIDAMVPTVSDDSLQLSSNAVPREFPHIAVIGYGSKTYKRPAARCAGSLISSRYVLSLASCSQIPTGPAAWVRLGDYKVNSEEDEKESDSRAVIYDIEDRINHPDYKKAKSNEIAYNDIALYRLKTEVDFNEYIRPICLYDEDSFANTFALTTGWGPAELGERPSEIIQKVNVTISDNNACSDEYKFHGVERDNDLNTNLTVCAAMVNGRDPCMNVPGSPLQVRVKEPYCMYRLAGLKYFGRACFVKAPGVYTRISHYLDWIESVVWS